MARVAVEARRRFPDVVIDGEIQANAALDAELLQEVYPFSYLAEAGRRGLRVNTLIFPNLAAGNIAHKLMGSLGEAEVIGPILTGMARPVHVLKLGSHAREILHMIAIAVTDASGKPRLLSQVESTPI
jgi:malate dehydrogenase (oxaloacetate-decarboxylating)(NADP+)